MENHTSINQRVSRTLLQLSIAVLAVLMSSCGGDQPTAVVVPFSEDAKDYLYQGGIGSVWEYSYKVTEIDTNGNTDPDDRARLIRFTMLDTGVTRKGVSGLTVVLRESIRSGVVGDTDTLYFSVTDSSLIMHYLPRSSNSGYNVILKEPLVVGAQFLTNPDGIDKPNGTVPNEITHAGVQRTVKAGTFSTIECRITTRMDGAPFGGTFEREETEQVALAPGNFFVWVKEIRRDTYPSGKVAVRIGDFELVRIEKR